MMGSAAAFDMARTTQVNSVTLADNDAKRAREAGSRVNRITGDKKARAVALDASDEKASPKPMQGHAAVLSAVVIPESRISLSGSCSAMPFRRSGRQQYCGPAGTCVVEESREARRIDCPGLRSFAWCAGPTLCVFTSGIAGATHSSVSLSAGVFGGRSDQRIRGTGTHNTQRETDTIDPLTNRKIFRSAGFLRWLPSPPRAGTSTLPESFEGRVGECFDPRRRYLIKMEPRWKKKISEFLEMIPPLRGGDFQGITGLSSDDSVLVGVSTARERSFTKAPALSNIGSMSPARLSPSAVASPHCRLLCHLAGKILAKKQRRLSGQPRIKRLSSLAGGWKSSNSCSPPVWGEIFS